MKNLVKTNAVVLKKIDYGDTSKIASLFTETEGRISVIVKGGRSSKSKSGAVIDVFNIVEVLYNDKESRDIQILNQSGLIQHFRNIPENIEKTKYASSAIEIINLLLPDREPHPLIFKGIWKILERINSDGENPKELFARFFLFFLKESGYELLPEYCTICGKVIDDFKAFNYNYEYGILCPHCSVDRMISFEFNTELFNLLKCLSNKNYKISYRDKDLDVIINFLEKFTSYIIPEFKGLKSLKIY